MNVLRFDVHCEYNKYACEDVVVPDQDAHGKWVLYSDYGAVLQQLRSMEEQLNVVLKENYSLREENAQLREEIVKGRGNVVWQD